MMLIVRESAGRGTVKGFGEPDFIERPATVEDIRQAVESGTIKGEEVKGRIAVYVDGSLDWLGADSGTYIVIGPVSDGGSET